MKAIFCITGLAIQGLTISAQAQTGKPNIVVIMTDQQRADLCGREGFPLEVTPFVDRLAQNYALSGRKFRLSFLRRALPYAI